MESITGKARSPAISVTTPSKVRSPARRSIVPASSMRRDSRRWREKTRDHMRLRGRLDPYDRSKVQVTVLLRTLPCRTLPRR